MNIPDLFNIIFNNLNIKDRRALLMTCNLYYKKSLNNIKYAVFSINVEKTEYYRDPIYELMGICDSFDICKSYIKNEFIKRSKWVAPIKPAFTSMIKENNYTLILNRKEIDKSKFTGCSDGYIIEEMMLNDL